MDMTEKSEALWELIASVDKPFLVYDDDLNQASIDAANETESKDHPLDDIPEARSLSKASDVMRHSMISNMMRHSMIVDGVRIRNRILSERGLLRRENQHFIGGRNIENMDRQELLDLAYFLLDRFFRPA